MEVLDKKTIPRLMKFAQDQFLKRIYGFTSMPKYGPVQVGLEVARSCNLQCPMCLRSVLQLGAGYMDLETCKHIVGGFKGVMGIGLTGWGEPLLNPDIISILRYISGKGMLIGFDTNGLLLKDFARDLVNVKTLYHIGLSFDLISSETSKAHDTVEVLEGFETLAKLKKSKGKKYPLLRVTMTVMNCNVNDMPNVVREIAKYGCTWFDSHIAIAFKEENPRGPYEPPLTSALSKAFNEAVKEGRRLRVKVTYERKGTLPEEVDGKKSNVPCKMPWDTSFIDFKGDAHPCCFHLDRMLGNAIEKTLITLWKGEAYRKMREELLNGSEIFCGNCMEGAISRNFH